MVGRSVDQKDEIQAYIKARSKLSCSLKQLKTDLSTAYGPSCVSYDTVMRWKNKFEFGVESIKKAPKSGRAKFASLKVIVKSWKRWQIYSSWYYMKSTRHITISGSTYFEEEFEKSERFLLHGCHICWLISKTDNRLKWPKSCFKCFQLMTKSSLSMSSQVMKLGSIILRPLDRLAIISGPLNTANAE